jgi:uncharacterized membrane protein
MTRELKMFLTFLGLTLLVVGVTLIQTMGGKDHEDLNKWDSIGVWMLVAGLFLLILGVFS